MEVKFDNDDGDMPKRSRRGEMLKRRKAITLLLKAANSIKDPLTPFSHFMHYNKNGIFVHLKSAHGNKLSTPLKQYIQFLLKRNMEGPYGTEWHTEEKVKHREMTSPEARYILLYKDYPNSGEDIRVTAQESRRHRVIVGFVHYRFVLEEEFPVLYVYELQLEPCVQGKGLGKFLMQLLELIAREHGMEAVMLTVQKANVSAVMFYTSKLNYVVSSISPSRMGIERNYEILCKAFDHEAKVKLV